MKKQVIFLAMLLCCCSCYKKEKLVIGGSGWQQIAIVDKASGQIEWKHELSAGEECNKVEMTPKGHILYAYKQGAKLIDRQYQVIWDYKANEREEIHYASSLKSGNFLLAACGNPARIVELDSKGIPVSEIKFNTAIQNAHGQFRHILKTPHNTYLIPLMGEREIVEMNREGTRTKSLPFDGNPFSIKLTNDGNWLVSTGDGGSLVEINSKTFETVHKIETAKLNSCSLLFVAEAIRYKNGNTLIANWNGHSRDKSQPLLLEINPAYQVVWQLPGNPEIKNISTVFSFFE